MNTVETLGFVIAWLLVSRYLYRAWLRNGTLAALAPTCSHGWATEHAGQECHPRTSMNKLAIAFLAIVAGMFVPFTIAFIVVMCRTPDIRLGKKKEPEVITHDTKY